MEINKPTWNEFNMNVSDNEWTQSGPVFREVSLYSHDTGFDTGSETFEGLKAQGNRSFSIAKVVAFVGKIKFDLKSSDVEQRRKTEGKHNYWHCNYWLGVEYGENVIYLRVTRNSEMERSSMSTAVIP